MVSANIPLAETGYPAKLNIWGWGMNSTHSSRSDLGPQFIYL